MRIDELDSAGSLLNVYWAAKNTLKAYAKTTGCTLYFEGHQSRELRSSSLLPMLRTLITVLQLAECHRILLELEACGITTEGEREDLAEIADGAVKEDE